MSDVPARPRRPRGLPGELCPCPPSSTDGVVAVAERFLKRSQTQKGGVTIRYQVNAVLQGQRTIRLVTDLEDKQQALYLEYALEKRLRIKDEKVPGEIPRSSVAA